MESKEIEMMKQYLPEGETHITKEQFTDERMAKLVNMLFLTETYKSYYEKLTEKEKANLYWFKKEVAYQVIQRLIGNNGKIPTVIQTEADWNRYFMFDDQESSSQGLQ